LEVKDILTKLLQVAEENKKLLEENNQILKELQQNGLIVPNMDIASTGIHIPESALSELQPKVSKDPEEIIEIDSGITTWIDVDTGLMWEVKTKETRDLIMSQKETQNYIDNLNIVEYGGYNDWRLPTLKELKTLLTKHKHHFSYIKKPLSKNTNHGYWTNTKYDENFYMIVNFHKGKEMKSEKHNLDYVRCVRG